MSDGLWRRAKAYRRLDPKLVRRELVPPAVAVGASVFLLSGLVAVIAVHSGPVVDALVVIVPTAAAAGCAAWLKLREIDAAVQRSVPLPPLVSSPRLAMRWATGADEPEIRTTMDSVMREENGWSDELAERSLLGLQVPAAVVAQCFWVGCDPQTGAIVGATVIDPDPRDPTRRMLGCWLGPDWRGQGMGTELVRLAIASALQVSSVDGPSVGLSTSVHNIAMQRSAEHAGGREVERYVHVLPDGREIDGIRYAF